MWSGEVAGSIENHCTGVPHDSDQWNSSDWPNANPKYVCREGGSRFSDNFSFKAWPFWQQIDSRPPDSTLFPQKPLSKIFSNKMIKSLHSIYMWFQACTMPLWWSWPQLLLFLVSWCSESTIRSLPSSSSWPLTNHHDTRRRCHLIGLFDWQSGHLMNRIKSNLIFPLRLKGVNCVWISVILGTQGRRGIPVPIYLRRMAQ